MKSILATLTFVLMTSANAYIVQPPLNLPDRYQQHKEFNQNLKKFYDLLARKTKQGESVLFVSEFSFCHKAVIGLIYNGSYKNSKGAVVLFDNRGELFCEEQDPFFDNNGKIRQSKYKEFLKLSHKEPFAVMNNEPGGAVKAESIRGTMVTITYPALDFKGQVVSLEKGRDGRPKPTIFINGEQHSFSFWGDPHVAGDVDWFKKKLKEEAEDIGGYESGYDCDLSDLPKKNCNK